MERGDKEQENLSRLEQAAQQTADPKTMQQKAKRPEEKFRFSLRKKDVWWTVGLAAAALLLFGIQVLINWRLDWLDAPLRLRVKNYVKGGLLIFIMLTVANVIEVFLIGRIPNRVSRFNLKRIFRLVVVVAIVFVAISVLFVNWYAAFVSLGLISLILGFALQMPISSFIAWIYILARAPYRVGDRIRIGDAHGDVIDVSYLDTTLWEFPGRIVKPLPWTGPALDRVRDHHASCGPIADAPGIEASGDVEARSVVGIGFADKRHSIRRVVVLIAPTPGNIADGQVLSRPLFQVDESCRDVPILTGVELGAQHDKQRTSVIPAGS